MVDQQKPALMGRVVVIAAAIKAALEARLEMLKKINGMREI